MILGLIGGGLTLGWIWWHNRPKPVTETEDETVTIAKLQIAVLEQAPQFQSAVQEWMQAAQTDDPVEHAETVKEIALLLLRNQSYWTHAELVETQKLRQDADQVFNYLTMEERSKFSSELFSDRFGIERYAEMFEDDSDSDVSEPGHVWVVTLLLGLEQNKLPIHTVHNASDLKQILSWVGSISPADLSVSEILFMPAAGVALGMEEFVEKYPTLNAL